jgi:chemotaxis protein MotA
MEHGKLLVLMQPAELIIIGGAALGTIFIANPPYVLKKLVGHLVGVLKGSPFSKKKYLQSLQMMYELLTKARKDGLVAIEKDIEAPKESPILSKYPEFIKDHHLSAFVCDTMRMAITGGVDPFDIDQMMELDMEVHHNEQASVAAALSTVADALPGLGIVAAVLGVVITMGALGGPPEEIGHKVAAALVGTFLGILLCYGFLGPIASHISKIVDDENSYIHALRVALLAFIKGTPPIMAVEMARRAVPSRVRPSFAELETTCRGGSKS